jgi:hypothetical protein
MRGAMSEAPSQVPSCIVNVNENVIESLIVITIEDDLLLPDVIPSPQTVIVIVTEMIGINSMLFSIFYFTILQKR